MGHFQTPAKTVNLYVLDQRCPTHSPLATCGEWPVKCGEWLCFQIPKY